MADVKLEVIDLSTGQSIGTFSLTICTPQAYELDIGSYQFKATYLPTGEVQTQTVSIIEGTNPQLDFSFTSAVVPPPSGDYDYVLDINQAGNFIVKDINGTTVHINTSIVLAIQWMANAIAPSNKKGLVKNLGLRVSNITQPSPSGLARIFNLTQGMNLDLETGLTIQNTNPTNWGILSFDGRFSGDNQRNGCVIQGVGGRAVILGAGDTVGGEKGVYIRQGSNITLRNLEIGKTGSMAVNMDADAGGETPAYNDHNTFEDLYIHEWAQGPYTAGGLGIDGSYNTVRRCIMDGMQSGRTRSALYIGAETSRSHDNLVEDCEVLNTRYDNGIYLNGWAYAVTHNVFRRIHAAGNQAGGHSGFKCRPSSYNTVEDLLTELNCYGIDIGTVMTVEEGGRGDDGVKPYDGWSRGNTFKRVISRSNLTVGLVLTVDMDGKGVELCYFDIYLFQNPIGIWFCNYAGGDGGNGFIQDNTFFVTIDTCSKDGLRLSAHSIANAYSRRNHFTGVIANCTEHAVLIDDLGVMDNYFDLAIINCGANPISDGGTRNRWNGVGKLPVGQTTPVAAEWNDGDIVVNQSNTLAWLKVSGVMQQLSSGQAIPQFTYMEGKGGLAPGMTQFIDKSFVAGRAISSWLWNFGDGSATSTLQHPTNQYVAAGNYTVTLTITDSVGVSSQTQQLVAITMEGVTTRNLTINVAPNGTTNPVAGNYSAVEGSTVIIFPTPNIGYTFDRWIINGTDNGTDNPLHLLMDTDYSVTPVFTALPPPPPDKQYLTIASVNGQTNPTAGTYTVDKNTSVTVTCTPNSGYRFKEWLLDNVSVSTALSYAVLMDANHGLVAVCEAIPPPPIYTLFISASIGGTTHPSIGTYEHVEGTIVNVAPIPDNGYRFANWTLDGQAITDNPINVTMNADHSLNAIFETLPPPPPQKQYLTIVAINGQTNPAAGTYELDKNSLVTITATPNSGYRFKEWLLDNVSAGTSLSIVIAMDANHTVVAIFEVVPAPVQAGIPVWVIPVALLGAGVLYLATKKK